MDIKISSLRNICLPSKAASLILVWAVVIGAIYSVGLSASAAAAYGLQTKFPHFLFLAVLAPYALLTLILILYPLSGCMADVYCGRFKAVTIGMCILCFTFLLLSIDTALALKYDFFKSHQHDVEKRRAKIVFGILACIGFILFSAGLGTFQANYIQLGLDQLMEAPTRYLGLFIHWVVWCFTLGGTGIYILFSFYICDRFNSNYIRNTVACLPPIFFVLLAVLLVFNGCYSRRWFYTDPGHNNPYKTVFKVLNFARTHKCPIRRSALTYYDDRQPSRIDFAKDCYGGPFRPEQVEDVKTFLRVLVVLLALGPVFVLEIPASYFIFPLFSIHTSNNSDLYHTTCSIKWNILESANLKYMVGVLLFPVYILLTYSSLVKRIPKILSRLWFGITLYIFGVFTMLVIDLIGHLLHRTNGHHHGQCMFAIDRIHGHKKFPEPLHMHWWVTIPPNVVLGIAPLLVYATAFEFISAQSPQSMKGFLVGVLFAIKGLFQLGSALVLIPFSLTSIWDQTRIRDHPPPTNCGFGYFLFTIVVALIGLIVFSVVAKRYKYRQRGEEPYGPAVVEDVYHRYDVQRYLNQHCLSPVDDSPHHSSSHSESDEEGSTYVA